jgi:SAM-dependent methyltransferase
MAAAAARVHRIHAAHSKPRAEAQGAQPQARAALAEVLEQRLDARNIEPGLPIADIALATTALVTGLATQSSKTPPRSPTSCSASYSRGCSHHPPIWSVRMNVRYRILYQLGITPWEREQVPSQLQRLAAEWTQPGAALDVGCGTGRDAVYLARHGWAVTAIDSVPQALNAARARAKDAGVEVNWVQGDVTELLAAGVGEGCDLIVDRGCFHGLSDQGRRRCAREITNVAAPGAQLSMFAFVPGRRGGIAPRGISTEQLLDCFAEQWDLVSSEADPDAQLPRWLRANPTWHRLKKRG